MQAKINPTKRKEKKKYCLTVMHLQNSGLIIQHSLLKKIEDKKGM
jgi:hypothetical protein